MAISQALKRWLAPPTATDDHSGDCSTPPHDNIPEDPRALSDDSQSPRLKRKHVSKVVDVDVMAREGFHCCRTLRCVEAFTLGKGDITTLRAEQTAMSSLTGASRAHFVHTMIPLVQKGRKTGAMVAGRQSVCTAFFRRAFNVSNNMIQALKNNPGSPCLHR